MATNKPSHARLFAICSVILAAIMLAGSLIPQVSSASAPVVQPNAPLIDGTEPLPPGATIETLLPNMEYPVALAFDPAGRLFYTEKRTNANANIGRVRLFENGVLNPTPVITFTVTSSGEQGLLGIAVDPNFNANHYIYVFYTCGCTPLVNKVDRFVENNGIGSNPTTIFESPNNTSASNHNGGNIHFAPDGKLYISLGDDGNTPQTSQDVTVKQGKIHRINSDGTFPTDNPVFTQTNALPSLYAMGLRNSFDFAYDPLTLPSGPYYRIFASENGPSCDDEMNRIEAGYNYGWRPNYPCDDANPSPTYNTIPPLWFLGAGGGGSCCIAPTGVMVYTGAQIPQWTGHLFMAGYNNQSLRHFYLNGDRTLATTINVVTGVSAGMDIETGPDGALWYIQGGGYAPGTLRRIVGPGTTATIPPATSTRTATSIPTSTPTTVPTGTTPPTVTSGPTNTTPPTITVTPTCPAPEQFRNAIIRDYEYLPQNVTILSGTTVRWLNDGPSPHTTTSDTGVWDSGVLNPGQNYQYVSGTPGTYPYHCTLHPGMVGSITVLAGCGPTTTPTSTGTAGPTNTVGATETGVPPTNTIQPTPTVCPIQFSDVDVSNTFYTSIRCLACRGIVSGYSDGTFRPNNQVTRGQLAKIVSNAAGFSETPSGQTFQDVPPTHTFYDFIERLVSRGIMTGYVCGGPGEPCINGRPYFRPFANATRGQTSKIVSNAAGFTETHTSQTFEDVSPSHTFYQEIERLASRGVMGGYPCGGPFEPCVPPGNRPYFRPGNDVTRGQSAKITANAFFPGCQTVSDVTIENFLYAPETLTVQVGAMVRWTNLDLDYHTSTSDTGAFDTGRINQNESYQRIFDTPGSYPYYCAPHPYMRGTIIVTAP